VPAPQSADIATLGNGCKNLTDEMASKMFQNLR
jgi:hypothetical protein